MAEVVKGPQQKPITESHTKLHVGAAALVTLATLIIKQQPWVNGWSQGLSMPSVQQIKEAFVAGSLTYLIANKLKPNTDKRLAEAITQAQTEQKQSKGGQLRKDLTDVNGKAADNLSAIGKLQKQLGELKQNLIDTEQELAKTRNEKLDVEKNKRGQAIDEVEKKLQKQLNKATAARRRFNNVLYGEGSETGTIGKIDDLQKVQQNLRQEVNKITTQLRTLFISIKSIAATDDAKITSIDGAFKAYSARVEQLLGAILIHVNQKFGEDDFITQKIYKDFAKEWEARQSEGGTPKKLNGERPHVLVEYAADQSLRSLISKVNFGMSYALATARMTDFTGLNTWKKQNTKGDNLSNRFEEVDDRV